MENGQLHFEKLVKIYNTTGKCFTYWSETMNFKDRKDVFWYLKCEYNWGTLLLKYIKPTALKSL